MIFYASLFCLLAALDGYFTVQLLKVRPEGELNPVMQWLAKKLNPTIAALIGIGIPTSILVGAAILLRQPGLMALACGARLALAWKQLFVWWAGRANALSASAPRSSCPRVPRP